VTGGWGERPGHVMAAEMAEQPAVLARLVDRAAADLARVRAVVPSPLAGTMFVARGSSDNAAVFGRYLAELAAGRPAGLAAPSLYTRYHAAVDWHGYLVVALSQSGATPEILTTCEAVRAGGAIVIGITNEPASPFADVVDLVLPTEAGPERAIPATKTVTAQFLLLATVAAALGGGWADHGRPDHGRPDHGRADHGRADHGRADHGLADHGLAAVPDAVAAVLADPGPVEEAAGRWRSIDRLVVSGRGLAYPAALETALKVKEVTGILAEGISTADLRHGPIAAVYGGSPALLLDAGGPGSADLAELRELIAQRSGGLNGAVTFAPAPGLPETARAIASVVRGQQLAHALARMRGSDPDTPAGLTKITQTT
jgi:glutamine---fructose-6-phosphate transaminase (isomerizing)